MPSTIFSFNDFEKFVFQQVAVLERYKADRSAKLSILFLRLEGAETDQVCRLLEGSLRQSDAIFTKDEYYFLVLPNTDKEGALHIINVLQDFFKKEIPEVIITYPEEASSSKEMLEKLVYYAKEEWWIELGDVITPY